MIGVIGVQNIVDEGSRAGTGATGVTGRTACAGNYGLCSGPVRELPVAAAHHSLQLSVLGSRDCPKSL